MRSVAVIALLLTSLAACGGLQSERADPHPRESDELHAREWHDRVVRLEGEAAEAAASSDDCGTVCPLAIRACELTARICDLANRDDGDEGTRVLCEDAEPRCASARGAAASRCECPG